MHANESTCALLLLAACGGSNPSNTPDAAGGSDAAATMPITLQFAAQVGGQPFACGQTYAGIGNPATSFTMADFRLYVHDLNLIASDGTRAPVTLDQDGK